MKELFYYIKQAQEYGPSQILILRIGKKEISCAVTNKDGSDLYYLAYCAADDLEEIRVIDLAEKYPAVTNSYNNVRIIFDHPESILLPSGIKTTGDPLQLLESYYGKMHQAVILTEDIPEWQLKNIYAVPKEEYDRVTSKFPGSKQTHHYTSGIKNFNASVSDGLMLVDFRKYEFTIIAGKQRGVILTQTFDYTTPEDVLFYLLKACREFSLSQKTVQLQISGLIDKQSALCRELFQYFINVEFREAGWGIAGNEFPAHFFTSLNDMAICAS